MAGNTSFAQQVDAVPISALDRIIRTAKQLNRKSKKELDAYFKNLVTEQPVLFAALFHAAISPEDLPPVPLQQNPAHARHARPALVPLHSGFHTFKSNY